MRGEFMDKKSQIRDLFKDFECPKFYDYGKPFDLHCANQKKCESNIKQEPIWTPAFGDECTKVMLVGEAPSTGGGIGPHLGGLWKNCEFKSENNPIKRFRDYFKDQLGYMPYFTDLVKCGPKNTRNKAVIWKRADCCGTLYLLNEIDIIDPESIYCIGRTSFDWLKKYELKNKKTGKPIEIKQLIHYGRQAGLPLTHEDKELIWKWQLGKFVEDKIDNVPLSKLSFFNRPVIPKEGK
jgi:uracil-DNA glycosylase